MLSDISFIYMNVVQVNDQALLAFFLSLYQGFSESFLYTKYICAIEKQLHEKLPKPRGQISKQAYTVCY